MLNYDTEKEYYEDHDEETVEDFSKLNERLKNTIDWIVHNNLFTHRIRR
jgi:hypothetical protein